MQGFGFEENDCVLFLSGSLSGRYLTAEILSLRSGDAVWYH